MTKLSFTVLINVEFIGVVFKRRNALESPTFCGWEKRAARGGTGKLSLKDVASVVRRKEARCITRGKRLQNQSGRGGHHPHLGVKVLVTRCCPRDS